MITAIILIQTDVKAIPETAEQIAALDGISEVYSVTGDYDLVAMARVRRHEDFASVIADNLSKVEGVVSTSTHIAFQSFSKHDLEAAFDLGF